MNVQQVDVARSNEHPAFGEHERIVYVAGCRLYVWGEGGKKGPGGMHPIVHAIVAQLQAAGGMSLPCKRHEPMRSLVRGWCALRCVLLW